MADTNGDPAGEYTPRDLMALANEHAHLIHDLMTQQADTEETSGYQIRDLQKQIVGLRKQRADDRVSYEEQAKDLQRQLDEKDGQIKSLQHHVQERAEAWVSHEEQIKELQKQLDGRDSEIETLQYRTQHLTEEMVSRARDAVLIEKAMNVENANARTSEATKRQLDDMNLELESYGIRFGLLRDEIRNPSSDTIAKAAAKALGAGGTATGERFNRIEERSELIESQCDKIGDGLSSLKKEMRTLKQMPTDVTCRLNEIKVDLDDYKATKKAICNAVGGTPKAKQ